MLHSTEQSLPAAIHLVLWPDLQHLLKSHQPLPILGLQRWKHWLRVPITSPPVLTNTIYVRHAHSWLSTSAASVISQLFLLVPPTHHVQKAPSLLFLTSYLDNKLAGHELHHPNVLKNRIFSTHFCCTTRVWSPYKHLLRTNIIISLKKKKKEMLSLNTNLTVIGHCSLDTPMFSPFSHIHHCTWFFFVTAIPWVPQSISHTFSLLPLSIYRKQTVPSNIVLASISSDQVWNLCPCRFSSPQLDKSPGWSDLTPLAIPLQAGSHTR